MPPNRPPAGYFSQPRDDLFRLVPKGPGRKVLDVGCGEGRFAQRLRELGQTVYGIEISPEAARQAAARLDRVYVGDAERADFGLEAAAFDTIVLGDVLEHLIDPWGFLRRMRTLLKPEGVVVASIPNVQYFPVVLSLIGGRFRYREQGVLDQTHLRFFTLREVRALFEEAGFRITAMPKIYPYRHPLVRRTAGLLDRLTLGLLGGFLVGNIYVVAQRRR